MRKLIGFACVMMFFGTSLFSQDTKNFIIPKLDQKVSGSLYNQIYYLDSRSDTTSLGIVQMGPYKKETRLVTSVPFSQQFANELKYITNAKASNGVLLMHMRRFTISEVTNSYEEAGEFVFRATLYAKSGNNYKKIRMIDTLVHAGHLRDDVTKLLIKTAGIISANFLKSSLLSGPQDEQLYSAIDILKQDSLEKSKLPLFANSVLKDGIYLSFLSFLNQEPDYDAILDLVNGQIKSVKFNNGTIQDIESRFVYAVVDHKRAFISTEFGYYALQKVTNDFVFTGLATISTSIGRMALTSLTKGMMGSDRQSALFEMKIDHINGSFVKVKQIAKK